MNLEKQVQEDYLQGESVINIAKKYNITREGVYYHLRKMDNFDEVSKSVQKRNSQRRIEEYKDRTPEILSVMEEGVGMVEASERLKIPYTILREILKGTKYDNSLEYKKKRNREIIKLYEEGTKQKTLAKMYGLRQSAISAIIVRWRSKKTSN